MSNRVFVERLTRELDNIGLPELDEDRAIALSRMIKIPRFKAHAFMDGIVNPDDPALKVLAEELEVKVAWLLGKQDNKN